MFFAKTEIFSSTDFSVTKTGDVMKCFGTYWDESQRYPDQ